MTHNAYFQLAEALYVKYLQSSPRTVENLRCLLLTKISIVQKGCLRTVYVAKFKSSQEKSKEITSRIILRELQ